jgi:hypothetical protein
MEEREREIMAIPGADERWENWMQFVAGRMVKKLTPNGFKRTRLPQDVYEKLSKAVQEGLANWDNLPEERQIDAVYTRPGLLPKFIYLGQLANEVHRALLPLHEAWSGLKLIPTSIYGVRFYQNGSSLTMHHDKVNYHAVNFTSIRCKHMLSPQLSILLTNMMMKIILGRLTLKTMMAISTRSIWMPEMYDLYNSVHSLI